MAFWTSQALVLWFGLASTVVQVILLREVLSILAGNEQSLAVSLAAWLLGVAVGAIAGGYASQRVSDSRRLTTTVTILFCCAAPLSIAFVRSARIVFSVPAGELISPWTAMLICGGSITAVALLAGFSFVPLVRESVGEGSGGERPAVVYRNEALGAFLGGLLYTFVFAGKVAAFIVVAGIGAILLSLRFLQLLLSLRKRQALFVGVLALVSWGVMASGIWMSVELSTSELRWQSMGSGAIRVAARETPYQLLELGAHHGQYDLFSNGVPLLSFPDPYERSGPVHVALTQTVRPPRRILLVGGGVVDRLRSVLHHDPESVTYVGLDPQEQQIVEPTLAREERAALADSRVEVVIADGRRFIETVEARSFDLIIIETADPVTALANRYYTIEFYRACERALTTEGVLAARVSIAEHYDHADIGAPAAVVYQSLRRVFRDVAIQPGPTMRFYASAASNVVTADVEILESRWRSRRLESLNWNAARFSAVFREAEVERAQTRLGEATVAENSDLRPTAYLYGLILWDQRARGLESPSWLWTLTRVKLWWLLGPIAALAFLRLASRWFRRDSSRRRNGEWAALTGGLAGLSLEILLLLSFQNVSGALYQALGILVALFMIGLAIGTYGAERFLKDHGLMRVRALGFTVDGATIIVALGTLAIPSASHGGALVVGGLLFLTGLCTGAVFPAAVEDLRRRRRTSKVGAAGLADGADHFGAFLGAMTIGFLAIPLFGVLGAVLTVVVIKLVSLVGWLGPRSGAEQSDVAG